MTVNQLKDPPPGVDASCPFQPAAKVDRRLKLFLWGDSGVGKTTLALNFPDPAIIDMEGGTVLYGEEQRFHVVHATTPDQVREAVEWLATHRHPFRTLIIDPITIFWESLQKKWSDIFLRRNKGTKGYKFEFYELQPKDWQTLKAEFKELIRSLIALDMNVIVTARQKVLYADGGFMKAIGDTFDGEKSLPYLFDTIVRLYRDEQGRYLGQTLKDRSNRMPKGEFETSIKVFEKNIGVEALNRESLPIAHATEEQLDQIRELLTRSQITTDQLTKRLLAYGAESLEDLTQENADVIIRKLKDALSTKTETNKET